MGINAFEGPVCEVLLYNIIQHHGKCGKCKLVSCWSTVYTGQYASNVLKSAVGWSISHPVTEFTDINGHYLSLKVGA